MTASQCRIQQTGGIQIVGNGKIYVSGYETAYMMLYSMINSETHQQECGECRPCCVIQEVIEILMETLAGKLHQDEFFAVAIPLARTNTGIRDSEGRIRIDWWGLSQKSFGTSGYTLRGNAA